MSGKFNKSVVFLRIVSSEVGVRTNFKVKCIFEALGLNNVIVKSVGSTNPITLVRALIIAIKKLTCMVESIKFRKKLTYY